MIYHGRKGQEVPVTGSGSGNGAAAKAILLPASDAAGLSTGELIAVNGGLHMGA